MRDQLPKGWRVVELPKVTQLMHNYVIGKVRWQVRNTVVEAKIPLSRTRTPTCSLITNEYLLVRKAIELIEVREPRMRERSRSFFRNVLRRTTLLRARELHNKHRLRRRRLRRAFFPDSGEHRCLIIPSAPRR